MIIKILLVSLIVAIGIAGHISGSFDVLSDPESLRNALAGLGFRGQLLFLAGFALIQPMGVPGFVFVIGAALLWPPLTAFLLCMVGSICAAVTGFLFARYVARDWVRAHLPERFHRFDNKLEQNSFRAVVLVYLVFFLAPPAHWVLGISRIRFWPFLGGAAVGFIPGNMALIFLGAPLVELLAENPLWLLVVAPVVVAGTALIRVRMRRKRHT